MLNQHQSGLILVTVSSTYISRSIRAAVIAAILTMLS